MWYGAAACESSVVQFLEQHSSPRYCCWLIFNRLETFTRSASWFVVCECGNVLCVCAYECVCTCKRDMQTMFALEEMLPKMFFSRASLDQNFFVLVYGRVSNFWRYLIFNSVCGVYGTSPSHVAVCRGGYNQVQSASWSLPVWIFLSGPPSCSCLLEMGIFISVLFFLFLSRLAYVFSLTVWSHSPGWLGTALPSYSVAILLKQGEGKFEVAPFVLMEAF